MILRTLVVTLLLAMGQMLAQTTTVGPGNSATYLKTDATGRPVHLRWGAAPVPAGWNFVSYCVGSSDTPGQEHAGTTQGGIVYKGCSYPFITTTSFDVFPFLGPRYYVIWAEFLSTDGTKVALSADSNEASCDFEVLSETTTTETFYCKGQVDNTIQPPTGLTGVVQ